MVTTMLDLQTGIPPTTHPWESLHLLFASQLMGEPFLFARPTYGEELTLHFGCRVTQPKTQKPRGSHVLSCRASVWFIKPGTVPVIMSNGLVSTNDTDSVGKSFDIAELEDSRYVAEHARIIAVDCYPVKPFEGIGLSLKLSDGTQFQIIPIPPDRENDEHGPPVADWQLLTPRGFLQAGPGSIWSFEPA